MYKRLFPLVLIISATLVPSSQNSFAQTETALSLPIITPQNAHLLEQINANGSGWLQDGTWSPDGSNLILYGDVGMWLYDADNLDTSPRLLPPNLRGVYEFSPTNSDLVAFGDTDSIELWNIEDNTVVAQFANNTEPILDMAFSPDGTMLAYSSLGDDIHILDVSNGTEATNLLVLKSPELGLQVKSLDFSPDGRWLVSGTELTIVRLWNVAEALRLGEAEINEGDLILSADVRAYSDTYEVKFSADGQRILVGNDIGWQAIDRASGSQLVDTRVDNVWDVSFDMSGDFAVSAIEDGAIQVWNTNTGDLLHEMQITDRYIYGLSVTFNRDATSVLVTNQHINFVGARVWQLDGSEEIITLDPPGHNDGIRDVVFSPDDTLLAASSYEGVLRVWDTDTLTEQLLLEDSGYPQFSNDGSSLIFWRGDGQQWIRNWGSGEEHTIPDAAWGRQSSPDGEMILVNEFRNGLLEERYLADAVTGEEVADLGNNIYFYNFLFSPDWHYLAIAEEYIGLQIWSVDEILLQGELTETEPLIVIPYEISETSLAFTRDGNVLAFITDEGIHLWNIPENVEIGLLLGTFHDIRNDMVLNPDETLLVVNPSSDFVEIWDISSFERVATLEIRATTMAFSNDGTLLATGGEDTSVRLWGIPLASE